MINFRAIRIKIKDAINFQIMKWKYTNVTINKSKLNMLLINNIDCKFHIAVVTLFSKRIIGECKITWDDNSVNHIKIHTSKGTINSDFDGNNLYIVYDIHKIKATSNNANVPK